MAGGGGVQSNPFLLQNLLLNQGAQGQTTQSTGPAAISPDTVYSAQSGGVDPNSAQGVAKARSFADGGIAGLMGQGNPMPQFNIQSGYNNYATPNAPSLQYPQQGQSNQPPPGATSAQNPPALSSNLPPVGSNQSPDMTGNEPSENMGFDHSGSDAGVGGQPVNQMQSPLMGSSTGQPPSLSQYMSPQGLQIQGNPTSQPLQRPQQR